MRGVSCDHRGGIDANRLQGIGRGGGGAMDQQRFGSLALLKRLVGGQFLDRFARISVIVVLAGQ
jgi:hypothetical protein